MPGIYQAFNIISTVFTLFAVGLVWGLNEQIPGNSPGAIFVSFMILGFIAVWIALSVCMLIGPLVKATPHSMAAAEAATYEIGFAGPAVSAGVTALVIGFKHWAYWHNEPLFLVVLSGLIITFIALMYTAMQVETHLTATSTPEQLGTTQ